MRRSTAVLEIRALIRRSSMFLGLQDPDPDPLLKGTDPLVKGTDPLFKGTDPLVKGTDPLVKGTDPLVKGTDPDPSLFSQRRWADWNKAGKIGF